MRYRTVWLRNSLHITQKMRQRADSPRENIRAARGGLRRLVSGDSLRVARVEGPAFV